MIAGLKVALSTDTSAKQGSPGFVVANTATLGEPCKARDSQTLLCMTDLVTRIPRFTERLSIAMALASQSHIAKTHVLRTTDQTGSSKFSIPATTQIIFAISDELYSR